MRRITAILCLLIPAFLNAQILEGKYVGYEKIDVRRLADSTLYFFPGSATPREVINTINDTTWFHEVIIIVNKDSVYITKIPVYIFQGVYHYSDSSGGFYFCEARLKKNKDSSLYISSNLKYKSKTGHTGRCNYFYVTSTYHNIRLTVDGFISNSGNLKNIFYGRIDIIAASVPQISEPTSE